jgi:hypothetical protein
MRVAYGTFTGDMTDITNAAMEMLALIIVLDLQNHKEAKMAFLESHCEETKKALGKSYHEVHLWLDEFFMRKEFGARYRRIRHHEQGIMEVVKLLGEEAGIAARMHIVTDLRQEGWTEKNRFPKDERDYVQMGIF